MTENRRQFETGTGTVINYISHKALQLGIRNIVSFSTEIYCKFTAESACKRILRSVNIWLSSSQIPSH